MSEAAETVVPVSCNLDCGAGCPLLAHVKQNRVVRISNNPKGGKYMTGCVRGFNMFRVLYSPDRLRKPLVRTGPRGSGRYCEEEWPDALDLVAHRLSQIREEYGKDAVLRLGGSGGTNGALHNTRTLTQRFLSLFGGYTEIVGSYSSGADQFIEPYVLGTRQAGIDPGTLQNTRLIILWGANVVVNRLGCALEARIREAKARGVEVIAIDPRKTDTVKALATRWIAIYPGTDAAMMMAVLHVLLTQRLIDRGFTEKYSYGFDELEKNILGETDGLPKTPQWAEDVCGAPAEAIRDFAQLYGTVHPAALIPGLSIQRTIGGEEAIRMSIALQVATGNLGVMGGSSGGLTWGRLPKPRIGLMTVPPNPVKAWIPQYLWADAILHGKGGGFSNDIKAIYNVGGNFLSQGSDIRKNIRAFEKVEFSVCHDRFMTPTAGYCDVVLPTTTYLERNDIVIPSGGNYLLYSTQAVPPIPETRNDYDIFCGLAERLGFLQQYSEDRDEEAWLRSCLESSEVEDHVEFRNTGIYWGRDQYRVGLSEFVHDPERSPLKTPSGKVQIFSQAYAQTGYSPTPDYRPLQLSEEYPLRLVTPKSRYRIHSQNWNIPWFRGLEDHALWIHPSDATARSIKDGDTVHVDSPQGAMRVKTVVTDDIMPGVVCLLEGAWPEFDTSGFEVAGSVNVLTSTVPTRPSLSSRTHTVSVQVAKRPNS